jgi:hypothetical protein
MTLVGAAEGCDLLAFFGGAKQGQDQQIAACGSSYREY